ncbi:hypothetical protein [Carnobacterium sp. TMP28]|uniref:hypothetical protein n=1 Tax=Carnobacterium sp. TMP28 TaxID=3397060 RepID=UPI0039DF2F88
MNEESLRENIIKNAQYLNSLLEQELYRIEQNKSVNVSEQVLKLANVTIEMTSLVIQISDIDAIIQNTMS